MNQEHRRAALAVTIAAAGLLLGTGPAAGADGADWPQFRGIGRDGISHEKGLMAEWPESGPKEVWRVPLGEGYSAVSVVGDRLYTMYAGDHEGEPREFAAAFEAGTGKEIWRAPVGPKRDTEFGNGPRSTPTVAGDAVYVLGSEGDLAALAAADGTVRWKKSLIEDFGSDVPHWGFSMSPLVDGGQVVVESGAGEGKSWVGLDVKTGEVKWTIGDKPAGYNSPLLVKMNGKTRYVYVEREHLMCIDENGKEIWSHAWPQGETHAMPVFVPPNRIFASGVQDVGAQLLSVKENGTEASVEEVWQSRFMRNHFSSSVAADGYIYGFDNATLKAISAGDAELAWAKRGLGKGSLILAGGNLVILSDQGLLRLVAATPEGYQEKGSVQALEGRCWTAPSFSRGRLYLRNHAEMVAYDLTK